jgi:RimK family alpha-L-glutamate ligase
MRIAVLSSPNSWYLSDLRRVAANRHTIECVGFRNLHSSLNSTGHAVVSAGEMALSEFDAVLVRTMPPGSLEQVVFRMDALAQLEASGVPVLNPPKAIEAAVDKYLTTARLAAAGLRVPRTGVAQSTDEACQLFAELGGDVVLKPLFGGEGRGLTRLSDPDLARRAFRLLEDLGGVIYLQKFIPHAGRDLRLLVIGDRVLGMQRVSSGDWRTNISRGARAEPLEVTPHFAELAHRCAVAVGAPLAGVDLLPGLDGELYAIEVNAVPGWQALARCTGVDVARLVLDCLRSIPYARTAS